MGAYELKTKPMKASVAAFIAAIPDERLRKDFKTLSAIMKRATGASPKLWGTRIVGFGSYTYTAKSGHTGEWPLTGFGPRGSSEITVYIMPGFAEYGALLKKMGPYKHAKSCLYLKRLEGLDLCALETIVKKSVAKMRKTYGKKAKSA